MALPKIEIEITADPTGVKSGVKQAIKAQRALEAATEKLQVKTRGLHASFKSGFIDQTKYAQSLDLVEKEFAQAAQAAASYAGATAKVTKSTSKFSGVMHKFGLNAKGSATQIRMIPQQFGQIAQQASVTGNVMQAVALQAFDIGAAFGGVGVAVGALVGFGIPTLIAAFGNGKDSVKDFDDVLDDVAKTLKSLQDPLDIISADLGDLTEDFGIAAERAREWALAQAEIRIGIAQSNLRENIALVRDSVGAYTSATNGGHAYRNALLRISEDFGLARKEGKEFETLLQSLQEAQTLDTQQEALEKVLSFLKQAKIPLSEMPEDLQRSVDEMLTLQTETARAKHLMDQLSAAAAGVEIPVGRGDPRQFGFDAGDMAAAQAGGGVITEPPQKPSGRGGRSRGIDALIKSLQTEREVIDTWHADSLEKLNNANAAELEALGGHNEARLRLEQEYQERLNGIRTGYNGDAITQAGTFFGDMATALQGGNEKMQKIGEKFAKAEAIVNAIRAYSQVASDPSLPWFAKIPAAISIAGAVSSAASSLGGGGGGSSPPIGSQVQAPAQSPLDVRLSGIGPNDLITGSQLSTLFDNLQDEAQDRGLNVSFAT